MSTSLLVSGALGATDQSSGLVMPCVTPDCVSAASSPASIYNISPLPKAGPRTGKRVGRKRGSTRIFTDTPEKRMIEEEAALRRTTKKSKQSCSRDPQKKVGRKAVVKQAGSMNDEKQKRKGKKTREKAVTENQQKAKKKCRKTLFQRRDNSDDSEEEEAFCLICAEPFSNSRPNEQRIQCLECKLWAHKDCTDGSLQFLCQNCDSSDDM